MGFSFQGIHSKEKKLKARITGYPMLPAFRNNTESIPGRSGILDFGTGRTGRTQKSGFLMSTRTGILWRD